MEDIDDDIIIKELANNSTTKHFTTNFTLPTQIIPTDILITPYNNTLLLCVYNTSCWSNIVRANIDNTRVIIGYTDSNMNIIIKLIASKILECIYPNYNELILCTGFNKEIVNYINNNENIELVSIITKQILPTILSAL